MGRIGISKISVGVSAVRKVYPNPNADAGESKHRECIYKYISVTIK